MRSESDVAGTEGPVLHASLVVQPLLTQQNPYEGVLFHRQMTMMGYDAPPNADGKPRSNSTGGGRRRNSVGGGGGGGLGTAGAVGPGLFRSPPSGAFGCGEDWTDKMRRRAVEPTERARE